MKAQLVGARQYGVLSSSNASLVLLIKFLFHLPFNNQSTAAGGERHQRKHEVRSQPTTTSRMHLRLDPSGFFLSVQLYDNNILNLLLWNQVQEFWVKKSARCGWQLFAALFHSTYHSPLKKCFLFPCTQAFEKSKNQMKSDCNTDLTISTRGKNYFKVFIMDHKPRIVYQALRKNRDRKRASASSASTDWTG